MLKGPLAPRLLLFASCAVLAACGVLPACGAGASAPRTHQAAAIASWHEYVHSPRVLDVAGPDHAGSVIVAAAGRLFVLAAGSRALSAYAPAYHSPGGEEPYIAVAGRANRCFGTGTVYALRLRPPKGVVRISRTGSTRLLARLHLPGLIDGVAFDPVGRFGHRLLVTVNDGSHTAVVAIGCHGSVQVRTRHAPRLEGGIAVAPASFGRFAGDLIVPDETGGRLFAVNPAGKVAVLARSGLPHGQDVGVESESFVPAGAHSGALVADRLTPGNRHPGDGALLRIGPSALRAVGVRAGDLLVATEGGALTDDVRCGPRGCRVREVASGPVAAHLEGHIAFGGG